MVKDIDQILEDYRKRVDQFLIDNDDSYRCFVATNDAYKGTESSLLCSISSYIVSVEPPDVHILFYLHPIEHLDKCPPISREAIYAGGEFSIYLESKKIAVMQNIFVAAGVRVDRWLEGKDPDHEEGQYIRPFMKALDFINALVGYHYGLIRKAMRNSQ